MRDTIEIGQEGRKSFKTFKFFNAFQFLFYVEFHLCSVKFLLKKLLEMCYVGNDLIFWVEIGYGQRHQLAAICRLMG